MNTTRTFRNLLSLTVVLALLFTCTALPAFAAESQVIETGATSPAQADAVLGNLSPGVVAAPQGTYDTAEVDVEKDVAVTVTTGSATGVIAQSSMGREAEVNVGGDVQVSGTERSTAISIRDNGGEADVNVGGDAYAAVNPSSPSGPLTAFGAYIESGGAGSDPSSKLELGGKLSADASGNGQAVGAELNSYEHGNIDADIGENTDGVVISAEAQDGMATGVKVVTSSSGTTDLNTHDGDISAVSRNSMAKGVEVNNSGTTTVEAGDGDVNVNGRNAVGVRAQGMDGRLEVHTDDIEAVSTSKDYGYAEGIIAYAQNDASTSVIADEIQVSAFNATGVAVSSYNGALSYVAADEITANAKKTSSGEEGIAVGAALYADGTAEGPGTNLKVEGNITADTVGVQLQAMENGHVYVTADHITGGEVGLSVVNLEENATAFASVQNVLHGDDVGILVNEAVTPENLTVAVWKIDTVEVDGEAHVALEDNWEAGEKTVTDRSRTVEQRVQYLIKIQEDQEDIIQEVDGAAIYPFIEEGFVGAATEGTKLTLKKLNLPDGCEVTGAYNGLDGEKVELLKDEDGNYYYVVPRGGGVILSVTWDKIAPGGGGDWYPGASWTNGVRYVDVTFDYNGGHKPASLFAGPVVKTVPAGTWVVLVEPPVKEGAEFLGWVSDTESVTVSKPGQSFCAVEPVLFTASWSDDPVPTAAERSAALIDALGQSETVLASAAADDLPAEQSEEADTESPSLETEDAPGSAVTFTLDGWDAALTLGGDETAPISLPDLLGSDGSGLSAKLVVDLGGGNALEIPMNIQISLGTPTLVTSSAE